MAFYSQSWLKKMEAVRFRFKRLWNFIFPWTSIPVRLPFGAWWLAGNDVCSDKIFAGNCENEGYRFVGCFLKPGMTMVDIGAHHGFYTLLAAKKIGPQGRVIAFEPSPRERKRLLRHLRLNNCKNVYVDNVALGNFEGEAEFFLVKGRDTGCNSLRPPSVTEPVKVVRVPVATLDSRLDRYKIVGVDFIKMDVEGAEMEVLKGAKELLQRYPRPVIYCEVQDLRTQAWNYKAKEIIKFLITYRYYWFEPSLERKLKPILIEQEYYDGNFVAVPKERIEQISKFL